MLVPRHQLEYTLRRVQKVIEVLAISEVGKSELATSLLASAEHVRRMHISTRSTLEADLLGVDCKLDMFVIVLY